MEILTIDAFLPYWENIRARTGRVIATIPVERFDWRPRDGAFSFADTIRHLGAIERYMFAENVRRRPSRYPGHGPDLADGAQEVIAFLHRMHAESTSILRALTPQDLQATCSTPGGSGIPVWKWLRAMVEHEVHHRGQLYMMLGLIGVQAPPLYGLTSEEVQERSVPLDFVETA